MVFAKTKHREKAFLTSLHPSVSIALLFLLHIFALACAILSHSIGPLLSHRFWVSGEFSIFSFLFNSLFSLTFVDLFDTFCYVGLCFFAPFWWNAALIWFQLLPFSSMSVFWAQLLFYFYFYFVSVWLLGGKMSEFVVKDEWWVELDENLVSDLTNFVLFCFVFDCWKFSLVSGLYGTPCLNGIGDLGSILFGFSILWSWELCSGLLVCKQLLTFQLIWLNETGFWLTAFVFFCFCFCFLYLPILSDLFSPRVYGHSSELLSLFTFCLKRGIVRKNCSLDIEGMKEREKIKVTRKGKVGFNIFAFIFLLLFSRLQ